MPDEEVIASLVRVKGIGRWSAQMFLMFRLGRPNVLPDLDLGVQKGIQHAYRLTKLPTPKDVLRIGERWAPYASVASWYMWRLLELPDVIRKEARARSAARAPKPPAKTSAARTPKPAAKKSAARTPKPAAKKSAAHAPKAANASRARKPARKRTASRRTGRGTPKPKGPARRR